MEIDDMMNDYKKSNNMECKFDLGIGQTNNDYTYKFFDTNGKLLTDEERKNISSPRNVIGVCYDKDGNVVSQTVGVVTKNNPSTSTDKGKIL